MLKLVAAGRGVAIVPERMASLGIDGVVFVPISDDDAKSVCALVLPVEHDGAGGRVCAGGEGGFRGGMTARIKKRQPGWAGVSLRV
ncbi:hypothetical protein [Burkholderia cepacia]|uniref:hypothetical protein n=1 Tax=Burkholderia cepacia TaxID=292 RepID=UPI002157C392|nr:hypothetical protein [Burkholderia cepacia]